MVLDAKLSNTYGVGLAVSRLDRLIGRSTPRGEGGLLELAVLQQLREQRNGCEDVQAS